MRLVQTNGRLSNVLGLLCMGLLASLVIVPQVAIAIYAIASPSIRATLAAQPVVALEFAVAFAFWVALVCWPLKNLLFALLSRRTVEIDETEVRVLDQTPFSTTVRCAPLLAYEGIAHHVRSSLSGLRHEAILVHPKRSRSLILYVAEHISDKEISVLCATLGMPRVATSRLYDFRGPGGSSKSSENLAAAPA